MTCVAVHASFTTCCYSESCTRWIPSFSQIRSRFNTTLPGALREKKSITVPPFLRRLILHSLRSFSHFLGQPLDMEVEEEIHELKGAGDVDPEEHGVKNIKEAPSESWCPTETDMENGEVSGTTAYTNTTRDGAASNKVQNADEDLFVKEQRRLGTPKPRTSIHGYIWWLLPVTAGIFLMTVYSASVTVLLFESKQASKFESIEDVKNCLIKPSRVAFIYGGASNALWDKAMKPSKCWKKENDVRVKNLEEGYDLLLEKKPKVDFFFSLEGSTLLTTGRRCDDLRVVGDPFFSTSVGFIVPRNVASMREYEKCMSEATRDMREEDIITSAMTKAIGNICADEINPRVVRFSGLIFMSQKFSQKH